MNPEIKEVKKKVRKSKSPTFLRCSKELRLELARNIEDLGYDMKMVSELAIKEGQYIDRPMLSRYFKGDRHVMCDAKLYWLCMRFGVTIKLEIGSKNGNVRTGRMMRTAEACDNEIKRIFDYNELKLE